LADFVMIHTDAFFRIESGKILGYKSSAISKEDIKDGKYKPGCLVYWTNMKEVSDAITQMPQEGESSQFMALSIDISNDTCTIKGQADAGMFFIPKDLIFKIGEPTSLDYIMDSANPKIPFTFSPLGFYSTKEQIQNLRSKLNEDTGVIQKAAESFEAPADAYAYAYSHGHADGRKKETYKPALKGDDREVFINSYRAKAETFNAETPIPLPKEKIYASIEEPCPSCGEIIEEITICSVCDYAVCVDCAEHDNSGWDYDEELFDEHRRSGDICPYCAEGMAKAESISIDDPCPSCGEIIEEIATCSVCDTRVCIPCAEDDGSGWFYDEDLFDEHHASGYICPYCAEGMSGGGFLSAEGFSLCRSCDDSCSWLNAEGICDECEDSFNAEEFQFLNELHGQV